MNHYQAYDYLTRSAQVMHEGFSLLNDVQVTRPIHFRIPLLVALLTQV